MWQIIVSWVGPTIVWYIRDTDLVLDARIMSIYSWPSFKNIFMVDENGRREKNGMVDAWGPSQTFNLKRRRLCNSLLSNFVLEVANIISLWLICDEKSWPCLVKKIEKKSYSLFYKYIGQVTNFIFIKKKKKVTNFIIYYFIWNTTKENNNY